ncbi:hypothetical protein Tco_0708099, partial [Tanacetum coccineum]
CLRSSIIFYAACLPAKNQDLASLTLTSNVIRDAAEAMEVDEPATAPTISSESPLLLVMNSLFQRICFGTHQDVEPLTFRTTKPCMTAATATAPRDPLSFSNSGSQTSFVHTLSTPAKEFVEGDRTANPQSRPLIAANQGTSAITPSSNGKHKREYRCVLPASQRHQGGSNRSVRRRSTMNCLGVRDLQPTTNKLAKSSSAHAENTQCIRDEVPHCQGSRTSSRITRGSNYHIPTAPTWELE